MTDTTTELPVLSHLRAQLDYARSARGVADSDEAALRAKVEDGHRSWLLAETVPDLRRMCLDRNLQAIGNKDALVGRLAESITRDEQKVKAAAARSIRAHCAARTIKLLVEACEADRPVMPEPRIADDPQYAIEAAEVWAAAIERQRLTQQMAVRVARLTVAERGGEALTNAIGAAWLATLGEIATAHRVRSTSDASTLVGLAEQDARRAFAADWTLGGWTAESRA